MPNLKIYVDDRHQSDQRAALQACLSDLRDQLCATLQVQPAACQMAVLWVGALPDQPAANIEFNIMPGDRRTKERLQALAEDLQQIVLKASGLKAGVRISQLDPVTYVALKVL